jgi:KaiC domain protein
MVEIVPTGIDGLDDMLGGGIPRYHNVAVIGACGTGKTIFGMQYMYNGLIKNEKGIYITLEEDIESLVKNAEAFGWKFRPYMETQKLLLVKLEPIDIKTTIAKIRHELPKEIKRFGAERVVVDSVALLSMIFENDKDKRESLWLLAKQLKDAGVTAIFTDEVKTENSNESRVGFVEYISDGVIVLRHRELDTGAVRLSLRILKMRGTDHIRESKPYEITTEGIRVYPKADVF